MAIADPIETTDVTAPGPAPFPDMVWIPTAIYQMGSDGHYPEERPAHLVSVDGFWIDRYPVTNDRFARFVKETSYRTFAELPPDPSQYPGALPDMLYAGSLVFMRPHGPVDRRHPGNWWAFLRGADWRHPYGPNSTIDGRGHHPAVHVAFADVVAFARWEGKAIPSEAEWELAARGGLGGKPYAWGDTLLLNGEHHMANTWQGEFPWQNLALDGYENTSPVDTFPPNGYGVFDMIGNVWEWTEDWYVARHESDALRPCCAPRNPRGASEGDSYDRRQPEIKIGRKVIKGGSHLCAPNYCRRYRPAARYPETVDTSTCHLGFRCIVRPRSLR